jgi:hypothetical protein
MKHLLWLFLLAGVAHSATVTTTWVNPTKNTDGTDIPATGVGSLASAKVEYGTCGPNNVFGTKAGEVLRNMPASSATLNLNPGTTCVRVTVTNTYGIESPPSNVASRVVDPPTPQPPQITTIAVVANINMAPVYKVTQAGERDKRYADACGFVPVGVECVGPVLFTFRDAKFRRVPDERVSKWQVECAGAAPCG